jgi:hypothetical protein
VLIVAAMIMVVMVGPAKIIMMLAEFGKLINHNIMQVKVDVQLVGKDRFFELKTCRLHTAQDLLLT